MGHQYPKYIIPTDTPILVTAHTTIWIQRLDSWGYKVVTEQVTSSKYLGVEITINRALRSEASSI
jgi:hypothetical protein